MPNFYKLCLLIFLTTPAFAQQHFIFISGKVVDGNTQKPVPFVNIQLQGGSAGTSSNAAGEFVFKLPDASSADTLLFSSIGYKTAKRSARTSGRDQTVILEPAPIQLTEVTVKGETALEYLRRALSKIPENYDTTQFHMMGFYREHLGLGDFTLSHTEAVLDVFKTFKHANGEFDSDQFRIVKGRKQKVDFSSDFRLYIWISGLANGARGCLAEDLVKNKDSKYNPFSPQNYKYYNYQYGEITQNGDRSVQIIDVIPKKKSRRAIMKLRLYVDETSLAIAKFEWDLTKEGVNVVERSDKGVAYSIMSVAIATSLDYHKLTTNATYKLYHGKWYLNAVNRRVEILVNSRKRKMVDRLWHADANLQITDIDTQNRNPITAGDIGKTETSMNNLVGGEFDEAFWENFNIVKPVIPDSLKKKVFYTDTVTRRTHEPSALTPAPLPPTTRDGTSGQAGERGWVSNRQNGFTRADTLRGKLTPLRTCYDVTFYHLDVAVNTDLRSIKGSNAIRFKVKDPFKVMQIDLYANMKIEKILFRDKPLQYTREFDAAFVQFPETLKTGNESEIKVFYEGIPKTPDWSIPMNGGVLWDKDTEGNTWAQMVCQGSGASLWWPNKDHLSDEPDSMKIWITVPSAFTEISNGRLIRKTPLPNDQTRYEWSVTYPINNYDVTFNIGKYTHYEDCYINTNGDSLSIDYYVMPYNLVRSGQLFKQVKPMLATFEKSFGRYPFHRDGFTLVETIYPMEHQSGVCIGKITSANSGETNPLLWHESAHEWWGNAISCSDMADMWFHEAFATYAEALVIEDQFGKDDAQGFLVGQRSSIVNRDPIIGVRDVNNIFYNIEDMYSKGSLVLHTFRNVLNNDTVWFDLLRAIQDHFRYQTLTSDDLIAFINEKTHTDYTYFFDQYLKHTTLPRLEVKTKQDGANLIIEYRWNCDVTNFRMPIKVTTAPDQFTFIYPETKSKTMILKNMDESQWEVDEEGFLVTVP